MSAADSLVVGSRGALRPRLLFLSHRLPYPPHNGASIRSLNILRKLAEDFDIHGVCFDRPDPAFPAESLPARVRELERYGTFSVFPIPQARSKLRLVWDHLRSLASGRAYTYFLHDSDEARDRVRSLLVQYRFSVVHVDSIDLLRFLPDLRDLPVALTHHNVESQLLLRRARLEQHPLRRWYLALQSARVRAAEATWAPRVRLNIAVSEEDAAVLAGIAPGAQFLTVPNGVDTRFFTPTTDRVAGCVFVGGTSWYPNRDGLIWFVAEVLPLLRGRVPHVTVTWVGRVTEQERERFGQLPGLALTGYVDDIRPYLSHAACFIAPLRVGGGTRLKLLDAWAMGKAVVSTPIGAEGLAAEHGVNILLADSAESFADQVAEVLRDGGLRRRLEQGARKTAEALYSWDVVYSPLRREYHALCTT